MFVVSRAERLETPVKFQSIDSNREFSALNPLDLVKLTPAMNLTNGRWHVARALCQ
jgi:hypothetical protein